MLKGNKNLLIIALIILVNTLGYAIIIPILYTYGQKFGLSDFQQGLLFALFSICQFFATPAIGRLSDKFGRKPLLIVSLAGTALSFVMMAFAPSAMFLFLARALDGITAGNFPVAMAVISDSTDGEERAKGFGLVSGAANFGFVFGPAIAAIAVSLNSNPASPFIVATVVTVISIILTAILLPETNKHMGQVQKGPLFNFKHMAKSLFDERVGRILLITLFYFLAFGLFIYAFNPFATKVLGLNEQLIFVLFTLFGAVGFLNQLFLVGRLTIKFGERKTLIYSLFIAALGFGLYFISYQLSIFVIASIVFALANAFIQPVYQTILSKEVDPSQQGSIMGIATSYSSVGLIVGPVVGGLLASISAATPFLVGAVFIAICGYIATLIPKHFEAKEKVV